MVLMGPVQLKAPRRPVQQGPSKQQQVLFLHPGYSEGHNILLALPAVDAAYDQDNDVVRYGIHHQTAQMACAILANCSWSGILSTDADGPAVTQGPDEVLLEQQYYFRLPDIIYPVLPSFEQFSCPSALPPAWSDDALSIEPSLMDSTAVRDATCRITASPRPNEIAHIIPRARTSWWQRNSMLRYITNSSSHSVSTDCPENSLLLRSDIHKMWDDNLFAIVPKAGKWVVHLLGQSAELEIDYHNLELQVLRGVSRHFLFCRFALAIFGKATFLGQGVKRHLVMIDADGDSHVRILDAVDYVNLFPPTARANSRNSSPKKRARSVQQDDEEAQVSSVLDSSDRDCDILSEGASSSEDERGRPRKRQRQVEDVTDHHIPKQVSGKAAKRPRLMYTPPRSYSPP